MVQLPEYSLYSYLWSPSQSCSDSLSEASIFKVRFSRRHRPLLRVVPIAFCSVTCRSLELIESFVRTEQSRETSVRTILRAACATQPVELLRAMADEEECYYTHAHQTVSCKDIFWEHFNVQTQAFLFKLKRDFKERKTSYQSKIVVD